MYILYTTGVGIDQAIAVYKLVAPNYLNQIGEKNMKIYTDYIFSTMMTHYKLYLYVFNQPREPQVSTCELEVDIPPEVLDLKVSVKILKRFYLRGCASPCHDVCSWGGDVLDLALSFLDILCM